MIPTGVVGSSREKVVIPKQVSLKAYEVFTHSEYYPEKWSQQIEGEGGFTGFNFWAFLLGYRWCLFRKLTRLGIYLFVLENLAFVAALLASTELGLDRELVTMSLGATVLGLMTFTGFYANYAYFNLAKRKITILAHSIVAENEYGEVLREQGGVSLLTMFVFIGIGGLLSALLSVMW
ncbi:DUF2628 domain-containing protein [Vibrio sp. TRT 21S02]|uniref:DUF2628 domain-containing protein n=1 Tax=Vibrio sp. TRT 21S02 TaxID=3418507 RepID=UPI003CED7668